MDRIKVLLAPIIPNTRHGLRRPTMHYDEPITHYQIAVSGLTHLQAYTIAQNENLDPATADALRQAALFQGEVAGEPVTLDQGHRIAVAISRQIGSGTIDFDEEETNSIGGE